MSLIDELSKKIRTSPTTRIPFLKKNSPTAPNFKFKPDGKGLFEILGRKAMPMMKARIPTNMKNKKILDGSNTPPNMIDQEIIPGQRYKHKMQYPIQRKVEFKAGAKRELI